MQRNVNLDWSPVLVLRLCKVNSAAPNILRTEANRVLAAPTCVKRQLERQTRLASNRMLGAKLFDFISKSYALRRAGIVITPHQFRHLAAKNLLDANPGNFHGVQALLGHKSSKTPTIYAGINSRRAARHHQSLIDQAVAVQMPMRKRKHKKGDENHV